MTLTKWNRGGRTNGTDSPALINKPVLASVFDSMFPSILSPRHVFSDNLIQDLFDDTLNFGNKSIGTNLPAVNISETDSELIIEMAAPGLNKNDFKVELNDNQLTIGYRREENNESQEKNHWRREFNFASFERTFNLPPIVEGEKITGAYTDGLLRLSIPKKEEARKKPVKSIAIN